MLRFGNFKLFDAFVKLHKQSAHCDFYCVLGITFKLNLLLILRLPARSGAGLFAIYLPAWAGRMPLRPLTNNAGKLTSFSANFFKDCFN